MAPCKRTKKHKTNRVIFEIKDFSDMLSLPPMGSNPIDFELVKVGSTVKICVSEPGERFWCKIAGIEGEIIIACVANELVDVPWALGMPLKFHRNRVYTVYDSVEPYEPFSQMENVRLIQVNAIP